MRRSKTLSILYIIWSLFCQSVLTSSHLALQNGLKNNSLELNKFVRSTATARNLYEQYTLGHIEDGKAAISQTLVTPGKLSPIQGAAIIYTHQYTETFNDEQENISLDFHYPDLADDNEIFNVVDDDNLAIITHIQMYVKTDDGSATQAYVTKGGIGDNNISLQTIATKTKILNYMLIIYGKAA